MLSGMKLNQVILSIKLPVHEIHVINLWSDFISVATYHNGAVAIVDGPLKWRIFRRGLIKLFIPRNQLYVLNELETCVRNFLKIVQSYASKVDLTHSASINIACNNFQFSYKFNYFVMKVCINALLQSVEIENYAIFRPDEELRYSFIHMIPTSRMVTDITDRFQMKFKASKSVFTFIMHGSFSCNFTAILTTFEDYSAMKSLILAIENSFQN